ncbi:MAG TPA: SLC13 family permease [Xenococcaceae cyanobacterium]
MIAKFLTASPLSALNWQGWLTIGVTIGLLLLNAATSLSAEIVFLGGAGVLFISGVIDESTVLAGFSNPGMTTVAVLYIVVTGLTQTGGLSWISQKVLGLPKGENSTLLRLMMPVIGLSAFLNNTPVVAMFIPVVNDWSRKLGISPSKLMIPLSYAAIFGGICTLIGTSTNLVVNGLLIAQTDSEGLKLFDITIIGLACAVVGTLFLLLTHRWLLPNRKPVIDLTDEDLRQYTVEMKVTAKGSLVGKTIEQAGLRHLPGLFLVEIARANFVIPAPHPQEILRGNDQLIFAGVVDSLVDLQKIRGLQPATDEVFKLDSPREERCLLEVIVAEACPLVGQSIREGQFRSRYNAVVLAVARNNQRLQGKIGNIALRAGDTLLLEAHPNFYSQPRVAKELYLINQIPDSEPLRHDKAPIALITVILMVALAGFGVMSMFKAAVLAAIVMIALQCCSPTKAIASIEWSVLLTIAAALAVGQALESTGAAQAIATTLINYGGDNPWLALIMVYGITTVLTEVITNNAAAALLFPIAIAVSQSLAVSYLPFVIAIMIAASASFATPIGYQTNLMVYGPGGYKFTDFMRIGIPLNIVIGIVTVIITPWIYPF